MAADGARRAALERVLRNRNQQLTLSPLQPSWGPILNTARQTMLDAPNAEHGLHRYWRSAFTEQISDELIDAVVDGAARFTFAAQCPDLLLHAWCRNASAADRDGICRPPRAVGFRCDRSVARRRTSDLLQAPVGWNAIPFSKN